MITTWMDSYIQLLCEWYNYLSMPQIQRRFNETDI